MTPSRFVGLLLAGALFTVPANAQVATTARTAPVPGQILSAKRVFISNAGSETYGSERYFALTRYDGGPNRFYNQFYAAMKDWGRYELTDSPATADVVYEVRFSNPIVDRMTHSQFVYDPQLTLTITDPGTRVVLWSLTEHIQPAHDSRGDNQNFDFAVTRIVSNVKMLVESPMAVTQQMTVADAAPPGAIDTDRLQRRAYHAGIGSGVGTLVGGLLVASRAHICPLDSGEQCSRTQALTSLGYLVGGAASGALIGWFWPLH